ncbi:MAG: acetyl-CoA carboxylase carboxyltransferase subunit alpha [Phycisphaeraceae bacterium]
MTAINTPTTIHELEFERPLSALERQIAELEPASASAADGQSVDIAAEVRELRQSHTAMLKKIYANLSAWNTVKVARHPNRPQAVDYIHTFVKDFTELHGDRRYGDDPAIITGFGRIGTHKVLVVAHNKGKDTRERIACHFGCAHPEGYRKALRCMKLAEKFKLPVVSLIDTPGAYPGIGAEERGQAEAIAVNLREMSRLKTPILAVVIGEGASGGALGIGVADRLAMMQYAWYSVISPEGCAAILWKTANLETNAAAAAALKLTATDNLAHGTIDEVIEEPLGAAHRNPAAAADRLEKWLARQIRELKRLPVDKLVAQRYERLRRIGACSEAQAPSGVPAVSV